ncbi:MAG: hypothetical protein MUQ30_18355 [Anaerolineae bacterium]|nr:hypothetical protein [Anaerolineae bacterium]
METNIKVLGWLYIVLGILGVLTGVIVLAILMGTGLITGDRDATGILLIVGVVVCGIVTAVSAPGIVVGIGLLKFKAWARVLALILGFLNLPGFPLGTVLGIYTFVSLLTPDAEAAFARI